ncbi:MAG: alpha-L-glutamate ligase-like protein [Pseudomonadota bacterium]
MRLWGRPLSAAGVLGINERNADFIMPLNPRRLYPRVDDKVRTKRLASDAGMAVPELYFVARSQADALLLPKKLEERSSFVVKPANGSGGDGIIVVDGRYGDHYRLISGELMSESALLFHVSNIVSGQFSLTGGADSALVEYRVRFDSVFDAISYQGVPDIRIIVYKGYPAMAMVRLPTRRSGGKANLHQGAVGAGVDIANGRTSGAVSGNERVGDHPDTLSPIADNVVPHWDQILEIAALGFEVSGLGYLGVDLVIDRDLGPLMLEMNARPGLNIQIANGAGLKPRFRAIDQHLSKSPAAASPAERAAISRQLMLGLGETAPDGGTTVPTTA